MASETRALATLPPPPPGGGEEALTQARAARDAALAEVTALDAEVEGRAASLAAFAAELERRLGAADAEARRAAGLVRRLQGLAEGLARELERLRFGWANLRASGVRGARDREEKARAGRRASATASGAAAEAEAWEDAPGDPAEIPGSGAVPAGGEAAEGAGGAATPEAEAAALKRLYRRLARLLHPDLARGEEEQTRLSGAMARANAALAAGDLQALELMAERLGAGEPPAEVSDEARLAHLARRTEQLRRVAASLARERARLAGCWTARLEAEAARRAAAGGDYFTEGALALAEEVAAARADALARLAAVEAAARALTVERRKVMEKLTRTRPAALVRGGFDPLAESGLVRRSAERLTAARATAPARALARWLEAAVEEAGASAAPGGRGGSAGAGRRWEAALTLLAYLMEAAGERPPPSVASAAGLEARWERLRAGWPGAPGLAEALAHLPPHLVLGARAGQAEVLAGLQLAEAALGTGVQLALGRPAVAALAREVLGALGPEERCAACRRQVLALHAYRTRGLDERHGLLCPRCGAVLRSSWRYGPPEGLEALAEVALAVGLVAEVRVRLADTSLGFGGRREEVEALTAAGLAGLFEALYLEPYGVALPRGAVRVASRGRLLSPRARLAGRPSLSLQVEGAGAPEGLVELLRARVERRFRPEGSPG